MFKKVFIHSFIHLFIHSVIHYFIQAYLFKLFIYLLFSCLFMWANLFVILYMYIRDIRTPKADLDLSRCTAGRKGKGTLSTTRPVDGRIGKYTLSTRPVAGQIVKHALFARQACDSAIYSLPGEQTNKHYPPGCRANSLCLIVLLSVVTTLAIYLTRF